ncbi:MAG: hypothetical protein QOE05_2497 [Actinomycetota bacterium]|nr:hypothetical protein [Actinomycetota bacterium]
MRRRTALLAALALLAISGCTPTTGSKAASSPPSASPAPTNTVWICKPGLPSTPCTANLDATVVGKGGGRTRQAIRPAAAPKADCFYVYPNVSNALADNAPRESAPEVVEAVHAQAALFSQVCRVFAPAYRQITSRALLSGKYFDPAVQKIAYDDVRDAWHDYQAHDNGGRPFVLIGHSQGAMLLTRLVQDEIDKKPETRAHLLSALLLGGNVTVASAGDVGGSFTAIPACTAVAQKGCVIAYSSYASTPPSYALFGHTNNSGEQVLCTDPSRLAGSAGLAHPFVPSARATIGAKPLPGTGFVAYPAGIRVACRSTKDATWLQVSIVSGSAVPRFQEPLGPAWGLHVADVTLALGDLVEAVRRQAAA